MKRNMGIIMPEVVVMVVGMVVVGVVQPTRLIKRIKNRKTTRENMQMLIKRINLKRNTSNQLMVIMLIRRTAVKRKLIIMSMPMTHERNW